MKVRKHETIKKSLQIIIWMVSVIFVFPCFDSSMIKSYAPRDQPYKNFLLKLVWITAFEMLILSLYLLLFADVTFRCTNLNSPLPKLLFFFVPDFFFSTVYKMKHLKWEFGKVSFSFQNETFLSSKSSIK